MPRIVMAAVAALLLMSCVPPAEGVRDYPPETPMGAIQKRGFLVVGIDVDNPPFGMLEDGVPVGFTVDLAQHLAQGLGVELRVVPGSGAGLLNLLDGRQADVVFPSIAVNEEWLRIYAPSDPYWVAHQRLLVPEGSNVSSFDDLKGKTVCSLLQPMVGVDPPLIDKDINVVRSGDYEDGCVSRLRAGGVDAITASDYTLISVKARFPELKIVGEKVTAEGYGAFVTRKQAVFTDFVNKIFVEVDDEDWAKAYREWIQPVVGGEVPDPPTMTVEEAGALYPTPVGG